MIPDDVRAAAEQLVQFHDRFAPIFGKAQAQDHAYDFIKGLMICRCSTGLESVTVRELCVDDPVVSGASTTPSSETNMFATIFRMTTHSFQVA